MRFNPTSSFKALIPDGIRVPSTALTGPSAPAQALLAYDKEFGGVSVPLGRILGCTQEEAYRKGLIDRYTGGLTDEGNRLVAQSINQAGAHIRSRINRLAGDLQKNIDSKNKPNAYRLAKELEGLLNQLPVANSVWRNRIEIVENLVNRKPCYATDKALVDDCVSVFLACQDSVLSQARDGAVGYDGISGNDAMQAARLCWPSLSRARLFTIHPERWLHMNHSADRFVTEQLCGFEWRHPTNEAPPPQEEVDRLYEVYKAQGTHWPFPDPLPFDSCFIAFGRKLDLRFSEVALYSRIRPDAYAQLGRPPVFLVGYLLAVEGDRQLAFAFVEDEVEQGRREVGVLKVYDTDEWQVPQSLDPWIVNMIVKTINDHKANVQDYAPTLGHRMERKKMSKQARQQLPLPAPFYLVHLKDELVQKPRQPKYLPGRPIEWSHRWDVRGHEVCRIMRGQLPISDKDRSKLKRRKYKIYEGMSLSAEDAGRLLKRGVRGPGPREWIAILTYWKDPHVKGDPSLPYVPAARSE